MSGDASPAQDEKTLPCVISSHDSTAAAFSFKTHSASAGLNDERLLNRSLSKDNLGIGLLSHVKVRSIMGDEALNFRVRNGIGCTRFSMDTKEIFQNI